MLWILFVFLKIFVVGVAENVTTGISQHDMVIIFGIKRVIVVVFFLAVGVIAVV
jgi:hypothetical protein